jgi:3-hydroxy-9,10-secoandrosta-1,3,5(10)-triene-9,17-dione monooxygenase reductase component
VHAGSDTAAERDRFRAVVGHFATGVAVITGADADGPVGMTANAVCSLSLEPLLLLVCFDNGSRTLPVVRATGRFGVNVLGHHQDGLAKLFASKRHERRKFDAVEHELCAGVPVISDALAWVVCELTECHAGGDHTIGIGAVVAMSHRGEESEPLVWYRGRYTTVSHRPSSAAPPLL